MLVTVMVKLTRPLTSTSETFAVFVMFSITVFAVMFVVSLVSVSFSLDTAVAVLLNVPFVFTITTIL